MSRPWFLSALSLLPNSCPIIYLFPLRLSQTFLPERHEQIFLLQNNSRNLHMSHISVSFYWLTKYSFFRINYLSLTLQRVVFHHNPFSLKEIEICSYDGNDTAVVSLLCLICTSYIFLFLSQERRDMMKSQIYFPWKFTCLWSLMKTQRYVLHGLYNQWTIQPLKPVDDLWIFFSLKLWLT